LLAEMGCGLGQGYLIARPMAADGVGEFVAGLAGGPAPAPAPAT